ncbi:18746_t:CDS:1, partial [Gigaspora rosea]
SRRLEEGYPVDRKFISIWSFGNWIYAFESNQNKDEEIYSEYAQ